MSEPREPQSLAELLADIAGRKGWGRKLEGARVHAHWTTIAGDDIARHSEPVRLVGGVLVLRADSAGWATQLRYLSGEIMQRANAVLGPGSVEQVKVVSGALRGHPGGEDHQPRGKG